MERPLFKVQVFKTQTTFKSWWWTGRSGVLRFMGSQRVGHDWATELTELKHAAWSLALCGGRGYNTSHHGYHSFSACFSFPESPGKLLIPPHLSNSIHIFSVNIQVIPRQIITHFYVYCFVFRLGRSLYRYIITCGTSLVDQWLRICLGSSAGKESACNAGDLSLIPGLGRSPGEGKGYPFQYSCLENSMARGAWKATIHGVAKSWTQLSD